MLTRLRVSISQYTQISSHYAVHLKLKRAVNYTSIKKILL